MPSCIWARSPEQATRRPMDRLPTQGVMGDVFADGGVDIIGQQKSRMGLFIRTIGIARARTRIGMANLVYNLTRFVWHQGRTAPV